MEAKVVKKDGGHLRKVTLSKTDDESEMNWTDQENIDEENVLERSTDEVFSILENVVTEWKVKLENVVTDGLKQIKKTHKEKKTMMKYLPGDGLPTGNTGLLKAKESILNEWKGEVTDIFHATHNKLSDLGINQAAEANLMVDGFFDDKIAKKNRKDENLNTASVLDMKNLMRELEILYQHYNVQKPYSLLLKEWNDNNVKMRESKTKIPKKKNMKNMRKGKKSTKGLKDRKEVRGEKKVMLREFEDKRGKHFIVVSKSTSAPTDVEDIFADWKTNFAQIKRPRSLKPRVRKLSHRQERKELIKEAQKESEAVFGPMTYSQMLRKNLRIVTDQPSVEDIFENWRAITEEAEDMVKIHPLLQASKELEDVDFFRVWKHNLHVEADRPEDIDILSTSTWIPSLANFECGQPTIPCIPKKEPSKIHVVTKETNNKNLSTYIEKSTKESTSLKPIKSDMQVVTYIERKSIFPDISSKKAIPLPDLFTNKEFNQQSKFKPGEHYQRITTMDTRSLESKATLTQDKPISQNYVKVKTSVAEALIVQEKVENNIKAKDVRMKVPQTTDEDFTNESAIEIVKTSNISKKQVEIAKPTVKRELLAETKNKGGKNKVNKRTWTSLIVPTEEPSGRGDQKQAEDIFLSWRYIFAESDISSSETSQMQPENIFFDWLFNLEQQIPVVKPNTTMEKGIKPSGEEISPKSSRKEERKQKKVEDIDERITDIKQNRRKDFVRNALIKDKKRTEANRRPNGKKIK